MAFNDTLFQLGMDLTRSSTAQEEDRRVAAHVAHEDYAHCARLRMTTGRTSSSSATGCALPAPIFWWICSVPVGLMISSTSRRTLKRCVEVAGATLLHIHLHHFTPNGGVSGVAVLSESHISIHSWPEADYAALDVFMCGEAQPQKCIEVLREAFGARDVVVKTHHRGSELEDLKWQAARSKQAPVRLKGVKRPRRAA